MESQDTEDPTPLVLAEKEKRVLELHDKLEQLQLEIALVKAQKNYVPGKNLSLSYPFCVSCSGCIDMASRCISRTHRRGSEARALGISGQVHATQRGSRERRERESHLAGCS